MYDLVQCRACGRRPGSCGCGRAPFDPPTVPIRIVAPRAWTPSAFAVGDWAGAAAAVGAGLGSMIACATLALLLLGVADLPQVSAGTVVAAVAMVVALAFGGSVSVTASTDLGGSSLTGGTGVHASPLLLTVVGLTVLAAVFVRRARSRRAGRVEVVTQAVRVWVLLCATLVAVCLAGRVTSGSSLVGVEVTTGVAGTLVGATGWLALVLLLAVAWRLPAVLGSRARRWRYAAAGPVVGAAVAVAVGCVLLLAGTVTAGLLDGVPDAAGSSTPDVGAGRAVAVLLLFAPNLLLAAFGFATGAPLSVSADAGASGFSAGMSRSLLDAAEANTLFWLAPVAVAIAVLVGGVVAALHAPDVDSGRRWGWLTGLALGAGLAVVAVATAVSVDGSLLGTTAGGTAHLHYALAPFAGLVWGGLGGSLGALLAPVLPSNLVHGLRRHVLGARHRAYGIPVPDQRGPVPDQRGPVRTSVRSR